MGLLDSAAFVRLMLESRPSARWDRHMRTDSAGPCKLRGCWLGKLLTRRAQESGINTRVTECPQLDR